MMLGQALTDTWLTKGHLTQARPEAERFLELTMAAAERTSQCSRRDGRRQLSPRAHVY
jgi:hypothetical protein